MTEESFELENTKRFKTYLNYISSLGKLMELNYEKIFTSNILKNIKNNNRKKEQELDRIGQLLRNSWYTEIQMNLSRKNESFIEYSLHWLPIQLYYSIYLGYRALSLSRKNNINTNHRSTLKDLNNYIDQQNKLFPYPWKILCMNKKNCVAKYKLKNYIKEDYVNKIKSSNLESNPDNNDMYFLFLKTTRDRLICKKLQKWKKTNKRKRMQKNEKLNCIKNLRKTSFMDCLLRMRIRSNYQDADSYLLSLKNKNEINSYYKGILKINYFTLLLFEFIITSYIGYKKYEKLTLKFLDNESELGSNLVKKRKYYIKKYLR